MSLASFQGLSPPYSMNKNYFRLNRLTTTFDELLKDSAEAIRFSTTRFEDSSNGTLAYNLFGAPCDAVPPYSSYELKSLYMGCQYVPTRLWLSRPGSDTDPPPRLGRRRWIRSPKSTIIIYFLCVSSKCVCECVRARLFVLLMLLFVVVSYWWPWITVSGLRPWRPLKKMKVLRTRTLVSGRHWKVKEEKSFVWFFFVCVCVFVYDIWIYIPLHRQEKSWKFALLLCTIDRVNIVTFFFLVKETSEKKKEKPWDFVYVLLPKNLLVIW